MPTFTTKPLDPTTWPAFAALVERHNGVWSGCWCMSFHAEGKPNTRSVAQRRCDKETRVREGRAHAALVYDGETCIGWCQFGPTDELPRIKHRRQYEAELKTLPDWRITCFFTDKAYRGQGVADAALKGAVEEIRRLGGGVIESFLIERVRDQLSLFPVEDVLLNGGPALQARLLDGDVIEEPRGAVFRFRAE